MYSDLLERIESAKSEENRNDALIEDIKEAKRGLEERHAEIEKRFYEAKTTKSKQYLRDLALENIDVYNKLKNAYKVETSKVMKVSTGAIVGKADSKVETKKKKNLASRIGCFVLGAVLCGATIFGISSCNSNSLNTNTSIVDIFKNNNKDAKDEEVSSNEYVDTVLKDANDNKQVHARAEEIYNTYCVPYLEHMSASDRAQAENICNIDQIENLIRYKNGLVPVDASGNYVFDSNTIDEYVAIQNAIFAQYPSSQSFGSQIHFIPLSTLFIDGSQEQLNQIQLDEKMEKVVTERRAENFDGFIEASKDWAYEYIEQFDRKDFNGQNNIYNIGNLKYSFYTSNDEQYICNIFEVIQGNGTSLCIDYCTEDGEYVSTPFVQVVDGVRNGQKDYLSGAAGTSEEYKKNQTTLPKQWYNIEADYFDEVCEQIVNSGSSVLTLN